jgi:hypothetical protein
MSVSGSLSVHALLSIVDVNHALPAILYYPGRPPSGLIKRFITICRPIVIAPRSLHEPLHAYRAEGVEEMALRPGSEINGFVPSRHSYSGMNLYYRLDQRRQAAGVSGCHCSGAE